MGLQLEMLKLPLALLFVVVSTRVGLAYGKPGPGPRHQGNNDPRYMETPPYEGPSPASGYDQDGYRYGKHGSHDKYGHDKEYNKGYDKHSEESKEESKSYGDKKHNYGGYGFRYGKGYIVSEESRETNPFGGIYGGGYRYGKHGSYHKEESGRKYGGYRTALDLGKLNLGSIRLPGVAKPLTLKIKVQPDPNPSKPVEEPVPEEVAEESEKLTAFRKSLSPWASMQPLAGAKVPRSRDRLSVANVDTYTHDPDKVYDPARHGTGNRSADPPPVDQTHDPKEYRPWTG